MTIIIMVSKEGGETGSEKRNAPKTKSSWSAMGSEDPGGRSSRRLTKDSNESPTKAPSESMNPSNTSYRNRTSY